jgi:hypothetical protein
MESQILQEERNNPAIYSRINRHITNYSPHINQFVPVKSHLLAVILTGNGACLPKKASLIDAGHICKKRVAVKLLNNINKLN